MIGGEKGRNVPGQGSLGRQLKALNNVSVIHSSILCCCSADVVELI